MEFEHESVEATNQAEASAQQDETLAEQAEEATQQGEALAEQAEVAAQQDEALAEQAEATEEQDEAAILNKSKLKIAEKVRNDSKDLHKLVAVKALAELMPENLSEGVDAVVTEMVESGEYPDLKTVLSPNDEAYLYSDKYMTARYAAMLSRIESENKGTMIATTVRDDSKTYPRPTHVEFFQAKLFNIPPDEFDSTVAHMLEQEEFKDIKLIVASTGARFLYSELYINETYARSLVEWEEVGQYENP